MKSAAARRLLTSAPFGVLPRKCACEGSGGKCAECKKKEETLQRRSVDQAELATEPRIVHDVLPSPCQPLDTATRTFLEPRVGHDFGKIRLYSNEQAGKPARAPSARVPLPFGGDDSGAPQPQDVAQLAGGDAGAGSSAPLLNYSPTVNPTANPCGGYQWKIAWTLPGAIPNTNGFVVQKIYVHYSEGICGSTDVADTDATYWEAWQVQGGQIVNLAGGPGTDLFLGPSATNHFGKHYQEGFAKFIPDYSAPLKWGQSVQQAGAVLSTYDRPSGWSDLGALHRSITSEFNCCQGADDTGIQADPPSATPGQTP